MMDIEGPPPILGSAKVLAFASIDKSMTFVQKHLLYVGGEPLGPVPKLAICKCASTSEVHLYYCDDEWDILGVSAHTSLDAAKQRAEKSYPGLLERWHSYHHEDEAAIDRQCLEPYCGFCGKSYVEAQRMIKGKDAWICEDCVRAMSGSLDNKR